MARKNKHNRRRRKGRFAFLYKVLVLLAICGAIVAAMALFFKANQIEITGNSQYTGEEVLNASGIAKGDNLFLLNKYEAAERIRNGLPYVETVRISRRLPDTLCIEVTECPCTLGIEQAGQLWLICGTGKIVDVTAANEKAPYGRITGVELTEPELGKTITAQDGAAAEQLLEMLKMLSAKKMLGDVQAIHLEDPAVITMRYMEAFDVQFAWHADFDYKLNYLAAVIDKLEENEKGTIILTQDGEAHFIPK